MTLEKEILEELKNGRIFVDTDDIVIQAIQLTQSKIIQIIDKRIEELKKLRKVSEEKRYSELVIRYDELLEELESLKKEVDNR
jgi:DNA-binding transcriptional regulator GbsR (MarR family)